MADTADNGDQKLDDKKLSIADILAIKKPTQRTVTVQLDGGLADQIEDLIDQRRRAESDDMKSNLPDTAPIIQEQIDVLRAQSLETEATFTFQSIGRAAFDTLLEQHPPTKEQKAEGANFNTETFPAALLALSCVDPEMTIEDGAVIWDTWNGAEALKLFDAARAVNLESADIPLSDSGSKLTADSAQSLITQLTEVSRTQSS